ncbi:AGAP005765-PA-like protein [Anopheles sinensis]|uniref:AGAP005765-PA-like protein n=1 Tax=Anopheles sinensis TaxID=74873 RepID=A0A084WJN5_ANOSI|nr:AGAP005765-PA-like protein [Anopheles sinensis]
MESLNVLSSPSNADDTETDSIGTFDVAAAAEAGVNGVQYRQYAGAAEGEPEQDHLRKGLNRISTDSASTYEIVDADRSPQSPASDGDEGVDGDEEDDDEEEEEEREEGEDEMWSNIVRINRATSATVAELTTGSGGSGDSNAGAAGHRRLVVNEIEYEAVVQEGGNGVESPNLDGPEGDPAAASVAGELLQRKRFDLARSSTSKEEKQRHNEEIVIMKSNSLSSDTTTGTTGSWEPVSVEACCEANEPPAMAESVEVGEPLSAPPTVAKACFIDASSLFDDDEVVYPSFQESTTSSGQYNPWNARPAMAGESSVQLATILSDDEKLRSGEKPASVEVRDQYSAAPATNEYLVAKLRLAESNSSARAGDALDGSSDREDVLARQEAERKQGTFLFQNSIQQYSGHLIEPSSSLQFAPEETYSDLSLPSVYSSSSEPPNYGDYGPLSVDNFRYSLSSTAGGVGGGVDEEQRSSAGGGFLRGGGGTSTSGYNSGSADYNSRTQATSDVESTATNHYPNTPFNSIVHVTSVANIGASDSTSRASSVDRESHSTPIRIPKRLQKHDESAPIVSGGASIEDFTPKQCESPSVRRRTDTCPIVSGGSISFDEPTADNHHHPRGFARQLSKSGSGKSWVVDLKNCPDDEKSAAMMQQQQQQHHSLESHSSGQRSLGFFVDLGSLKTPEDEKPSTATTTTTTEANRPRPGVRSEFMKKSTGFYIDLSDDGGDSTTRSLTPKLGASSETPPPSASALTGRKDSPESAHGEKQPDRSNMFSMFIDIGQEGTASNGKPTAMPRKLSMPHASTLGSNGAAGDERRDFVRPSSLGPSGEEASKPYYMFIGAADGPPAVVRRTHANGGAGAAQTRNDSKRHSWNTTIGEAAGGGGGGGFHERRIASNSAYQRSTSVTSDRGIMNILDKIPLLSKTSSMSIDSSVSPFEDFTCSKSELSNTYSNHSISSSNSAAGGGGAGNSSGNDSKASPNGGATKEGEHPVDPMAMTASAAKKKRRDAKINETFDKSSQGSVTDGILSSNEDASPTSTTTDTDDVTFQNNPTEEDAILLAQQATVVATVETGNKSEEQTIKLSNITTTSKLMETIQEAVESSPKHTASGSSRSKAQHTMETLHATIEKQKQLLETVSENVESAASVSTSFVKLSDMDKPPVSSSCSTTSNSQFVATKFELHSSTGSAAGAGGQGSNMSNSAGSSRVARLFECQKYNTIGSAIGASNQAMMRQHQQQQKVSNYYHAANGSTSMERHSWNMSRSTGNSNFVSLISSSVENSRSLSRLFPHLTKAFSSSLPSDVGMNGSSGRGQEGNEYTQSDFSCTSSVTSSRSGIESIDESISSRQPRRLGEDLLKMFLQEIATDVTIEVEAKKMRAHKCILRSRCQYFAAILAGSWVQNAGNVISLPGYSYAAVHFALCHIYSGASHPPEGISLMELAALSDLLGLEGLKEVTAYALKTNYCHNFHKPCVGCTDGVLQVLPVTLNHGLDDLYRKCLKWVCRHYVKIWSQKQFSQLPLDVVHRCRQQIVAHLSSESVLTTILDSEQLLTLLHPYKWSVEVENVVRDILDASYDYITDHFASLLASDSFLSLGQNYRWAIPHVEPILLPAANNLSADQACKSYPRATRLHKLLQAKKQTKAGARKEVDYNLQEEEMDWCDEFVGMVNAILSAVEQCLIRQCARAMRVSSWQRMDVELRNKIQKLACLLETTDERKSRSRYSYSSQTTTSSSSSIHSRTNDLRQVRLAIQAHTKRAYENGGNNKTQQTQTNIVQQNDLNAALLSSHKLAKYQQENGTIMPTVLSNAAAERLLMKLQATENGGRLSKTASKSNVPAEGSGGKRTIPLANAGRPSGTTNGIRMGLVGLAKANVQHKRSQSEDHAGRVPPSAKPVGSEPGPGNLRAKLNNVKPRYLEPKKPKNAANLHAQNNNNHISSSGSSTRTSSPALSGHRKPVKAVPAAHTRAGHESNLSLDSLSSPAKQKLGGPPAKPPRTTISEMDVSIDSLAESLKSMNSIKTSNTLSHESLIYQEYFKPKTINNATLVEAGPVKNGLHLKDSNKDAREKRPACGKPLANGAPARGNGSKANHHAPPSGIAGFVGNRGINGINRTASSASVGSNAGGDRTSGQTLVKRSFLSQRSREILARRSHEPKSNSTNSSNKSAASSPSLLLTRDKSTGSDITKSGSSASLTTTTTTNSSGRKVFNTTLHLRRTAKLPAPETTRTSISQERKGDKTTVSKGSHRSKPLDGGRTAPPVKGHAMETNGVDPPAMMGRVESKLERSNTFSMDASDNPMVLQMLEQ